MLNYILNSMKNYILTFFIALFSTFGVAQEIPELNGRVNFNGSYQPTEIQKQELIKSLQELDKEGKVQMAILVVDSVKPSTIEQFSIKVAEKWKVGKKNVNNGIIFVVATKDRKARLEVGRGLEGVLTDAMTSRIQKEKMAPFFKKGDYFGGINSVVNEIKVKTTTEIPMISAEMEKQEKGSENSFALVLVSILGFGVVGFVIWLVNNNKKQKIKQEEEMKALSKQWREEYRSNQRKYKPINPIVGAIPTAKTNRTSSTKSRESSADDIATGAILGSILSSSSDEDSRKSSSSSDSFSSGGGDYSGGGSSSDW